MPDLSTPDGSAEVLDIADYQKEPPKPEATARSNTANKDIGGFSDNLTITQGASISEYTVAAETGSGEAETTTATGGGNTMTTTDPPSREEVNAKLEAVEARLETRLVKMDTKLDVIVDRLQTSAAASNDLREELKDTKRELKNDLMETKKAASTIKWNILFTGLAVAGVMVAVFSLWTQGMEFISNMIFGVSY